MKFEIYKFRTVTSTNDVAINLIKENKAKIGFVCADIQTQGRGTQGRKWISKNGNLFGTFFFPLKDSYPPFNEFSIINPIIISDVIKNFCDEKRVSLKFPNDVFVNGKKICGVLQEQIVLHDTKFLIIGIGMNIISNPYINDKYKTTNILLETKKEPKIEEVINLLISSYENFFVNLNSYNYINFKKRAELMVNN